MKNSIVEELTKATQGAEMVVQDLRAAHRAACGAETTAEELALILLEDALQDARKLADKIKRIHGAATGC